MWISLVVIPIIIIGLPPVLGKLFFKNRVAPHRSDPGDLDIDFSEVRIPTLNHRQLYGWWIEDSSTSPRPVIILIHGWGRNVGRMLPYIQNLVNRGYHLVAFDSRNHGSSDPDNFSSMLKFAEDIEAVIQWVSQNPKVNGEKIGLVGLSIGGAASLYAAAHNHHVKATVTVGAFADPIAMMDMEFRKHHIPRFPLPWLMYRYLEYMSRKRIRTFAPINNISAIRGHVLLIHGTEDTTVPYGEAVRLRKAGDPNRTELWSLDGFGHSDCHEHPEFWSRLITFFQKNLS